MPINTRNRQGVTGTVTYLVDLLDRVNLLLPPRTATALTRWKGLNAALVDYRVPPVGPARANAVAGLVEAAGSESVGVDEVINRAKVMAEHQHHDRCEIYRGLLIEAVTASRHGVVSSANADEQQIVVAAQGKYAELAHALIDAAVKLPEEFGERDALYANDQLREPWLTATRTWADMLTLRELVSAFDTFTDLDSDWGMCVWTKSGRYAEAWLFREQRSTFGEPGSISSG